MAREDFINFLVNYGGRCRDCADEDGFCPGTGIGCGQRRKAVEFILGAIDYGTKHGFSHGYQIIHRDENHGPTLERAKAECDRIDNECGMEAGLAAACSDAIRAMGEKK